MRACERQSAQGTDATFTHNPGELLNTLAKLGDVSNHEHAAIELPAYRIGFRQRKAEGLLHEDMLVGLKGSDDEIAMRWERDSKRDCADAGIIKEVLHRRDRDAVSESPNRGEHLRRISVVHVHSLVQGQQVSYDIRTPVPQSNDSDVHVDTLTPIVLHFMQFVVFETVEIFRH
jgi:hypothetical protein